MSELLNHANDAEGERVDPLLADSLPRVLDVPAQLVASVANTAAVTPGNLAPVALIGEAVEG